jgi:amino acid transporter
MSLVSTLLGRPLASDEQDQQKIGPTTAVPAMGLDGLTSSAYGPEAALTILVPLGAAGLVYIQPITFAILALLLVVYFSYRQTIAAYPVNGGSYTVARENIGTSAGLLAAAALMVDYILNVAVGISAGVAALVSAVPSLHHYTLLLCLGILILLTLVNLRGTAEAGWALAPPTYLFIASLSVVLILGIVRTIAAGGHPHPIIAPPALPAAAQAVGMWLILRSFASGCTAMTGVEAVSNSVSAFKQPVVPNAHRTLTIIVVLLAFFLGAIAVVARSYGVGAMDQTQPGYQSILSQLTSAVVGRGWFYYVTLGSVLATLCLSANTSFVGFPRVARLVAQDDFLPRSFAAVGRRLVYSAGILFLAGMAGLLLAVFRGITDRLIPLFAIGAFLAFTLSQTGMVFHWRKQLRQPVTGQSARQRFHAHARLWVNGVGAVATGIALIIILAAKFVEGAWIVVIVIPSLFITFRLVHRHYRRIVEQTTVDRPLNLSNNPPPVVLVPIRNWDRLTEKALRFSMWLSSELHAVHLSNLNGEAAEEETRRLSERWKNEVQDPARKAGVPPPKLVVLQTPYRNFLEPLLAHIEHLKNEFPERVVAVVVPEVLTAHWWQAILHTRKAAKLRSCLIRRGDHRIILIRVPWYVADYSSPAEK